MVDKICTMKQSHKPLQLVHMMSVSLIMASNSQVILKQCSFILKITGYQYFSNDDLTREKIMESPELQYRIYFIFIVILMSLGTFFVAAVLSIDDLEAENEISVQNVFNFVLVKIAEKSFLAVTLIGFMASFVGTKDMMNFYGNFQYYKKEAALLSNYPVNYEKFRKHVFFNVSVLIVYFALGETIHLFYAESVTNHLNFPYNIIFLVCLFVYSMSSFMFVYHVILINIHLEHINYLVENIFTNNYKVLVVTELTSVEKQRSREIMIIRNLFNLIKRNSEILDRHQGVSNLANFTIFSMFCVQSGFRCFLIALSVIESSLDG